jgi:hypothetical protein
MLVSLLLIGYALFTALVSGMVFVYLFSRVLGMSNTRIDFPFLAISGFCWLAVLLSIQHLFYKVGIVSHILVWLINGIAWSTNPTLFYAQWKQLLQALKHKPVKIYIVYTLFIAGAVVNIMARPAVGDAADYHLQAIRWMEEYKVVPGIGNIRRQLGNNSNWFLLNAFFGFSFTGLRSVYVLNAALLVVACVFFSEPLEGLFRGEREKLMVIKSLVLVYLTSIIFRKYVGAVTNDFAITIMILYVFTLFLDTSRNEVFTRLMIFFFIPVMITFKLSALPLAVLLVFLFFGLYRQVAVKEVVAMAGVLILLLAPWIYTNIRHCGYLVFPISSPDLFDVDWKMRKSVLEWEVMANLAWARVPFADVAVTSKYVFAEWFPRWLRSLDGFSIVLMAGSIVTSTIMLICFSAKKLRSRIREQVKAADVYIFITIAAALYLWFTHGPTPRFVFGYLVFICAAWIGQFSLLFPRFGNVINGCRKCLFWIVTGVFLVSGISFLPKYFTTSSFAAGIVKPRNYTDVKARQMYLQQGYVNVPENGEQCWDFPLPCTSEPDTMLTWRGTTLEEGFKLRK